jgi:hypothetical protein
MFLSVEVLLGLLMPAAQPQKVSADQTSSLGGMLLRLSVSISH